jgi:group I intron endonuclease
MIYLITNVANGKRYVGQTRNTISRRMAQHKHRAATGCPYALHAAIRKYGWDYFRTDVLAKAETQDELNALEREFIERGIIYLTPPSGDNLKEKQNELEFHGKGRNKGRSESRCHER